MLKKITTALCLCFAATAGAQTVSKAATMPAKTVKHESQSALRKEAKVTMAQARATALKEVPNGRVRSSELERENGKLIYSFDIRVPGKSGIEEVNVDAVTGAVAGHEHETPKIEAKEKKTEKR
jgi:uncharacterized membrane protein YkoI